MKLQAASRKEVLRITLGTLVCDVIMVAGLFLLSQFDIGTFELNRILLGALGGSVIGILNFIILCLTIQNALNIENKRKMKAAFQFSYNTRTAIQAIWVIVCFFVKPIHFVAGAAPLLFPKVTLLYLQFTGKLMPKEEAKTPEADASGAQEDANQT